MRLVRCLVLTSSIVAGGPIAGCYEVSTPTRGDVLRTQGGLGMSLRCLKLTAVLFSLAVVSVVLFVNLPAAAQDEVPQYDVFIGYQWLHPGATVATFKNGLNPVPRNLEEMPKGIGGAFAWNFSPHWALEGDVGTNGNVNDFLSTFSAGPRFMLRLGGPGIFPPSPGRS